MGMGFAGLCSVLTDLVVLPAPPHAHRSATSCWRRSPPSWLPGGLTLHCHALSRRAGLLSRLAARHTLGRGGRAAAPLRAPHGRLRCGRAPPPGRSRRYRGLALAGAAAARIAFGAGRRAGRRRARCVGGATHGTWRRRARREPATRVRCTGSGGCNPRQRSAEQRRAEQSASAPRLTTPPCAPHRCALSWRRSRCSRWASRPSRRA